MQVVGLRLTRYIGEIVVTQSVLLRVGPIGGYVVAFVLLPNASAVTLSREPSAVVVRWIRYRVRSGGQLHAIGARKRAEVVVESVILFDDDDYMRDGIRHIRLR